MILNREQLFKKGKQKEEIHIEEWIDFFAERYGWTLPEIMDLPIPVFFALQEAIQKKNEREKRDMERKRR